MWRHRANVYAAGDWICGQSLLKIQLRFRRALAQSTTQKASSISEAAKGETCGEGPVSAAMTPRCSLALSDKSRPRRRLFLGLHPPAQNYHRCNLIDHVLATPTVMPGFVENLVRRN
jgi:hypothetical protein